MTHAERLAIARDLVDRILATYGDVVLAIYITSSTAKGMDRPHSDLELTTVMRDGIAVEDKSYLYRGILIELSYPQAARELAAARRVRGKWPEEADGYRSRIVLFERDGWLQHLAAAVAESDRTDALPAVRQAALGLVEERDKVRNAWLARDALDLRVEAFYTAHEAANLVLLLNRRYMTTTRSFFPLAFACPAQPPEFRGRTEILLGLAPASAEETATTVEHLCADLLAMVRARGILLETDDLIV